MRTCRDVHLKTLMLLWVLLTLACTAHSKNITGRVVGVADGDTITVLDADKVQHKIRLAGIDTPEKKQAFGNRSKESLSAVNGCRKARFSGGFPVAWGNY